MKKASHKYITLKDGTLVAWLLVDGKLTHKVNIDHLFYEHCYKNGWLT